MSDSSAYKSSTADKTYLDRAYALQSPNEAKALYDEWAKSYDTDLSDLEYVFHRHAADALLANLPSIPTTRTCKTTFAVLDAGCGTGLVGVALNEALKTLETSANDFPDVEFEITGLDISPGMLRVAMKTGLYKSLQEADLTKPLIFGLGAYDLVVCVGTLTRGHVGPGLLSELVRVTAWEGVIVATVLEEIWEAKGFEKEVKRLAGEGGEKVVEVLSIGRVGVVKGSEEGGRLIVLRKV